jgi:hypothetical protein
MLEVNPAKLGLTSVDLVESALRNLGPNMLKKPYKEMWSEENPTLGFCYVVSEAFFHYSGLSGLTPMVLSFPEGGTHWWLKTEDDDIIDFTSGQFDFPIDYSAGTRCPFFKGGVQTDIGFISKRGQVIAEALSLIT